MSMRNEAPNKLDKLFKLDFYKKQERWKLRSANSNTKRDAGDTTEQSPTSREPAEEKITSLTTDDDKPTILAPPVVDHNGDNSEDVIVVDDSPVASVNNLEDVIVIDDSPAASVPCRQSVSTRLSLLLALSKNMEAETNESQAYVDTMSIDEVPLTTQEDLNAIVFEENLLDEAASSCPLEEPVTNQHQGYDEGSEQDKGEDYFPDVDLPYSPIQNCYKLNMKRESTSFNQETYVNFMREIHDAPHSSNTNLDFNYEPEDIDSCRLAELSPYQLWQGLTRYSVALQKLLQENTCREMLYQQRQYQSTDAISSTSEDDTILAASFYTVDENRYRRIRRTHTTYY